MRRTYTRRALLRDLFKARDRSARGYHRIDALGLHLTWRDRLLRRLSRML